MHWIGVHTNPSWILSFLQECLGIDVMQCFHHLGYSTAIYVSGLHVALVQPPLIQCPVGQEEVVIEVSSDIQKSSALTTEPRLPGKSQPIGVGTGVGARVLCPHPPNILGGSPSNNYPATYLTQAVDSKSYQSINILVGCGPPRTPQYFVSSNSTAASPLPLMYCHPILEGDKYSNMVHGKMNDVKFIEVTSFH